MSSIYVITLLVIAVIIAVMGGVYRWLAWTREVEERLARSLNPVASEVRHGHSGLKENMNGRIRSMSFGSKLEHRLTTADSKMSVSEFVMLRVGLTLLGFSIGWLLTGTPIPGIPLAFLGWIGPSMYLSLRISRRAKQFGNQLPDMLTMLVGSLRAGYGLLHAITVVESEMPSPIGPEFGRVVKETALGYTIGDALDHLVLRIENSDLEMIVTAIHVQNEVGGSLAEVLESITRTIRDRIHLKGEIQAMTAQQRITGTILTALPFLVGTILMLMNPDYMLALFEPGWILALPATAVVMVVIGNIVMRSMTKIEY